MSLWHSPDCMVACSFVQAALHLPFQRYLRAPCCAALASYCIDSQSRIAGVASSITACSRYNPVDIVLLWQPQVNQRRRKTALQYRRVQQDWALADDGNKGYGSARSVPAGSLPLQGSEPWMAGNMPASIVKESSATGVASATLPSQQQHTSFTSASLPSQQQQASTASCDDDKALQEAPPSSWLSNVFKLLITHLQLLGLLRAVRMDWPSGIDKLMAAMDQTQSTSSWVMTECLFAQEAGARLRPSVARTMSILLLPGERMLGLRALVPLSLYAGVVPDNPVPQPLNAPCLPAAYQVSNGDSIESHAIVCSLAPSASRLCRWGQHVARWGVEASHDAKANSQACPLNKPTTVFPG